VLSVAAVRLAEGRTLLASGDVYGSVRLWDPATGAAVGQPLTGHPGGVLSVAAVRLAEGRTLLASGGSDGSVRLWRLAARDSRRTAPALRPAGGRTTGRRRGVLGALKALGARDPAGSPPTVEPPAELPVPEVEAELVATLVASRTGGWATVLPDGRSYKSAGDVSDVLWWAIKLCRFEAGELDRYDPTIQHLPHPRPIL
jgi:hypothetical protein